MCSLNKQNQHGNNSLKMTPEYPIRLIPRQNFRSEMDRSQLQQINPWLQRKCFCAESECCVEGDKNRVTRKAFGDSGLYKMSVNILGGLFEIGDEKWHQLVGEEDNWTEGEVDMEKYEDKYCLKDITTSIYFNFNSADTLDWQFPRRFNDKDEFDACKEAIISGMSEEPTFSKKQEFTLKGHSECYHTPNCLNYWHVEVRSIIDSMPPTEIADNKQNYKKRALRNMIEVLRKLCTLNPPKAYCLLPETLYVCS